MAALSQMGAVTGRRLRPRYTDRINAMLPYLPDIYAQKEASKTNEELISLENQRIAQTERLAAEENRLTAKGIKEQKKSARKGMYLTGTATAGQLGIEGLKYKGLKDIATGGGIDNSGGTTGVGGSLVGSGLKGVGTGGMQGPADTGFFGGITDSLKSGEMWTGAGVGTMAGNLFGGDDPLKSGLIGAGAGALTSWLTGGGLVDTIMGGFLGGIGGAIF